MANPIPQASLTGRCCGGLLLDANAHSIAQDDPELLALFQQEQSIDAMPAWVSDFVSKCLNSEPPCGHCTCPRLLLQIVDTIGGSTPSESCKDCCKTCQQQCPAEQTAATWWPAFCASLDAWWKGDPEGTSTEQDLQRRLGERTNVKRWLVRLYRHKLRMLASSEQQTGECAKTCGKRACGRN